MMSYLCIKNLYIFSKIKKWTKFLNVSKLKIKIFKFETIFNFETFKNCFKIKMGWFNFGGNKKINLSQCQKFLGSGAFGMTYLTTDNLVVKIEPSDTNKLSVGDDFGINIIPTLDYQISKHFTQIFSVQFLKYNPLPDLKCIEPGMERKFKFENKNPKFYKITVMEYAGEPFKLTDELGYELIKQLINPVCAMLSLGYFHNDIHSGNIMLKNGIFKITDYGGMKNLDDFDEFYSHHLEYIVYSNIYLILSAGLPSSSRLDLKMNMKQKIKNYKGPKKYLAYWYVLNAYIELMDTKIDGFHNMFDNEKFIDALYYIADFDFYIKGEDLSVSEYKEMICEKGFTKIAKKLNELLF